MFEISGLVYVNVYFAAILELNGSCSSSPPCPLAYPAQISQLGLLRNMFFNVVVIRSTEYFVEKRKKKKMVECNINLARAGNMDSQLIYISVQHSSL